MVNCLWQRHFKDAHTNTGMDAFRQKLNWLQSVYIEINLICYSNLDFKFCYTTITNHLLCMLLTWKSIPPTGITSNSMSRNMQISMLVQLRGRIRREWVHEPCESSSEVSCFQSQWVFCLSRGGSSLFCRCRPNSRINEKLHLSNEKSKFTTQITQRAHISCFWLLLICSSMILKHSLPLLGSSVYPLSCSGNCIFHCQYEIWHASVSWVIE